MMQEEIWKPVIGYEGYYEVSNYGHVRSTDREIEYTDRWGNLSKRHINPVLRKYSIVNGYLSILLCKEGNYKSFYVHRLVASAFILNTKNLKEINHIDGNKQNNNVDNLEWVTSQENQLHAVRLGLKSQGIKIRCIEDDKLFQSCADAARYYGINTTTIIYHMNRNSKSSKINKTFVRVGE